MSDDPKTPPEPKPPIRKPTPHKGLGPEIRKPTPEKETRFKDEPQSKPTAKRAARRQVQGQEE